MPLDITVLISHLWPFWHAQSAADAVFISDAEATHYFADWLKRIAETYGVFLTRDTTFITFQSGVQVYTLPPRHLATVHVSLNGKPIGASSTKELEASDDNFQTTLATVPGTRPGPIARYFEDKSGANEIGFYPVPAAGDTGSKPEIIFWQYPCNLDEAHTGVEIDTPAVIGDLLELLVVKEGYQREGDFEQPEVAQAITQLTSVYFQAMKTYYGSAQ
jgi:hypothetical protein